MPVYEYECRQCGERFELFVRFGQDASSPTCPKCGSTEVRKALSLFGLGGGHSLSSSGGGSSCGPGPV